MSRLHGASPDGDRAGGAGAPEPAAQSQPKALIPSAARPFAKEFIRQALTNEIATMLVELGNPPLVDRIFPRGWRNAPDQGLRDLFDLCVRTLNKRGAGHG